MEEILMSEEDDNKQENSYADNRSSKSKKNKTI